MREGVGSGSAKGCFPRLSRIFYMPSNELHGRILNMSPEEIIDHQASVADRILQNWIATQTLAKDAPAFAPQ